MLAQAGEVCRTPDATKRPSLELDSAPAIAMVSAGLGISVLHLSDPGICLAYSVRVVPLGPGAPVLHMSLVTRKADDDDRRLLALKEAMEATSEAVERRAAVSN